MPTIVEQRTDPMPAAAPRATLGVIPAIAATATLVGVEIMRALPASERLAVVKDFVALVCQGAWVLLVVAVAIMSFGLEAVYAIPIAGLVAGMIMLLDLTLAPPGGSKVGFGGFLKRAAITLLLSTVISIGLDLAYLKEDIDLYLRRTHAEEQASKIAADEAKLSTLEQTVATEQAPLHAMRETLAATIEILSAEATGAAQEAARLRQEASEAALEAAREDTGVDGRPDGQGPRYRFAMARKHQAETAATAAEQQAGIARDRLREVESQLEAVNETLASGQARVEARAAELRDQRTAQDVAPASGPIERVNALVAMHRHPDYPGTSYVVIGMFLFCFVMDLVFFLVRTAGANSLLGEALAAQHARLSSTWMIEAEEAKEWRLAHAREDVRATQNAAFASAHRARAPLESVRAFMTYQAELEAEINQKASRIPQAREAYLDASAEAYHRLLDFRAPAPAE